MTRAEFLKGFKSCPFCGAPVNTVDVTTESGAGIVKLTVYCGCGVTVDVDATSSVYTTYCNGKEQKAQVLKDALQIWNTRESEDKR